MKTREDNSLLIAFYGDDFTGSTDALEFLSREGIRTVLFIDTPDDQQLKKYEGLQAIGIAGKTRTMSPADMESELRPAFEKLKQINPGHIHYKVCSTFDSSPETGSIGTALDTGVGIFQPDFVPLLVAAPVLGRFCVFGNLFARMGIGSNGSIYRLDRHPSMSRHPVTPANESDLRLHLEKQTEETTGLIDILQLGLPVAELREQVALRVSQGNKVVLIDALHQEQMKNIGYLIDSYRGHKPVFSVGSSGIEMALGACWKEKGLVNSSSSWENAGYAGPVLIASGSCSPVTSAQIAFALSAGFAEIEIDTESLAEEDSSEETLAVYVSAAAALLGAGRNVLIHTSRGNDDLRVIKTDLIFKSKGLAKADTARLYGTFLGEIARRVAVSGILKRIIIAGGDTSSYAARQMGIEAVEMIAAISPGAPLCRAYAPGSPVDGLEVNFKGGQVGKEDYFITASGEKPTNQIIL